VALLCQAQELATQQANKPGSENLGPLLWAMGGSMEITSVGVNPKHVALTWLT